MKFLFRICLVALMISVVMISSAQPPPDHPAMLMRKYYADIYTGQSIVSYESHDIDSVLMVVSKCVVSAQVISVYSYINSPYNDKTIFAQALEKDDSSLSPHYSFLRVSNPIPTFVSAFSRNRTSEQYRPYYTRDFSGCYNYW